MKENVTTRNFRQNLKFFFDKALDEPVAVNRAEDRFVLMSETEFKRMQQEIFNLQRSLISSLQIQSGEGVEEIILEDGDTDPLLDEYVAKYEHLKKKSKVG